MKNIFQFLVVSLVLTACNSSPYSYYTSGSRCDEAYNPNPVNVPAGTTAKYEVLTEAQLPQGTYKFSSLAAYFQDKQSDLHIYIAQGLDTSNTTKTTYSYGVPCVRNYVNVGRVPVGNLKSDLTSVVDLTVDGSGTITGHTNTLGYQIDASGIAPVPGADTPTAMTGTIADVYNGMDAYKIYRVTDKDGNGADVTFYEIRAEKKNDAQGYTLRQVRIRLNLVVPVATPAPSPSPTP